MRKIKQLAIIASVMIVTVVLLWFGQLRYSWNPIIEQDRFIGYSYAITTKRLGNPTFEHVASNKGYEIEPQADFNHIVVYEPLWGSLLLYFKDDNCVGSVFFTNNIRF